MFFHWKNLVAHPQALVKYSETFRAKVLDRDRIDLRNSALNFERVCRRRGSRLWTNESSDVFCAVSAALQKHSSIVTKAPRLRKRDRVPSRFAKQTRATPSSVGQVLDRAAVQRLCELYALCAAPRQLEKETKKKTNADFSAKKYARDQARRRR